MHMHTKPFTPLLMIVWWLSACVTINIYFPAAQAQEAAEKIVEDILSGSEERRAPTPAPTRRDEQSSAALPVFGELAGRLLNFLVAPVHAAPNFSVDSPEIRKIQASLKNRHSSLKPFYASGAIGFAKDGTVAVRDDSKVPLKERGRLKGLVTAENQDRNALYRAIAVANGHPEWERDVRQTFAETWVQQASTGWWYQNPKGQWVKK